jgi:hypothetical protein
MAIAIAAVASIVTLILLYSGLPFFGPVNDLINAVSGILIAGFVWQFYAILREKSPTIAILLMLIAWAGAIMIIGNSILVAFGRLDWKQGGLFTIVGYALIGIWFIGMLLITKEQAFLNPGLTKFGLIAGICMLFGFLAGPLLAEKLAIAFTPLVWIAYAGAGAGWIMFPLWCWRFAVGFR